MFEEIKNPKRLPSAQETKKRLDYLDLVLGKLPEVGSQRNSGSRNGKKGIAKALIDDSEASTAYKTELT